MYLSGVETVQIMTYIEKSRVVILSLRKMQEICKSIRLSSKMYHSGNIVKVRTAKKQHRLCENHPDGSKSIRLFVLLSGGKGLA